MLKAAARFVEAGEIRDVTHKMWESKTRRRDLVEKVCVPALLARDLVLIGAGNRIITGPRAEDTDRTI